MTIKELEMKVTGILNESEDKKNDFIQKINSASEAEHEAIMKAAEAYKSGDVHAYHLAQDQLRQCQDAQKMYGEMLKAERENPIISGEEYKEYLSVITSELDKETQSAKKKILSHLEEIISISQQNSEAIENGDKLMHTLQHEVMKDDACMTNQAGVRVWMSHLEKKYKDLEIVGVKDTIAENWLYKSLKERCK